MSIISLLLSLLGCSGRGVPNLDPATDLSTLPSLLPSIDVRLRDMQ